MKNFMSLFSPVVVFLSLFLASCNSRDSVELDSKKYARLDTSGMTASQIRFAKAKQVFVANCAGCHPSFLTRSEPDYNLGADPLVTPGDLSKSAVYRVLRSAGPLNICHRLLNRRWRMSKLK